jgi:hypothetical protein
VKLVIDISDIQAARERIASRIRRTPNVPLSQVKSPLVTDARVR